MTDPKSGSFTQSLINQRELSHTALSIFLKWMLASILSFAIIAALYAGFLGRYTFIKNESIYGGHHFVGKPGTVHLFSNEGYGVTSFGQDGLIVNKKIDHDLPRLLFLGDSFVEANHVSDKYKFTEVIERRWNIKYPDQPVQTLNLGLSALDMRTYLQFSQEIDAQFSPSLIFVLLDYNDFRVALNDSTMLANIADGQFNNLVRPGKEPFGNQILYRLNLKSFAVRLKSQTVAFTNNPKMNVSPSVIIDEEVRQAAYRIQLKALKKVWGARLVVIHHEHVTDFGENHLDRDRLLEQTISDENIRVIKLYDALYATTQARKPPYGFSNSTLGQGHFNRLGHEIIAGEILHYLESVIDFF